MDLDDKIFIGIIILIFLSVAILVIYQSIQIKLMGDFCDEHGFDYYADRADGFVSCCKKTNKIDTLGVFTTKCEVFKHD